MVKIYAVELYVDYERYNTLEYFFNEEDAQDYLTAYVENNAFKGYRWRTDKGVGYYESIDTRVYVLEVEVVSLETALGRI